MQPGLSAQIFGTGGWIVGIGLKMSSALKYMQGRRGSNGRIMIQPPNAVKFFNAIELIALLGDTDWLDEATKTIGQFWRRKNARRNGLSLGPQGDDTTHRAPTNVTR
jgi:hypothetical protein